jgi:tetratricopeptide (TPR) repeat protein
VLPSKAVRKLIAVLTVALAGATAAALAYQVAARQRDYRTLVRRGDAALRDDLTFPAIEAYSGAIALRPDSMLAYLRRGETYRKRADRGDLEAAARDFRKAASLDPSASRPLEELGDVRYALEQYDRAAEAFERVTRLDDRSPRGLYKLALACYRSGDRTRALTTVDQAIRLDDRVAEAHYLRGVCLREKRRPLEAVKAIEKAVALSPALVAAREELADVYGELDRRADQLDQLQVLAALDRTRVERQVAVARAHARARRYDAAILVLSGALERSPDNPVLYAAIGQIWLESAQARNDRVELRKAREALERAAGAPGASSAVLALAGRAASEDGDDGAAASFLQQAADRFPVAPSALLLYAAVEERQNRFDGARRALIAYDALARTDADAATRAARIAALSLRVGDAEGAADWIRRGLSKDPQNAALAALAHRISASSDRSRPAGRPREN